MNLISTASPNWRADCFTAAENGDHFYVLNLNPEDVDFLAGLAMKFPRPKLWSGNSFFYNPPMDATSVGQLN